MKINIDKSLVEFTPENADEKSKLQALWRLMVDCARFNKKMVPVGEYLPDVNDLARFAIEGYDENDGDGYPEAYTEADCRCFCQTCNKYAELKNGERVPPCCGKLMEILD